MPASSIIGEVLSSGSGAPTCVSSGSELLRCVERGVWLRQGEIET